jgi:2-polyprenyl-6-methoxyphenol hydroxylase-like FAD-dependent oxidoreductase
MGDNFAKHAIVVGGGMAGLLAAAAMSNFFEAVTICECDDLEDDDEVRPGVPQGAHIHTLLGYGAQSIERLLPEFNRRLYKAGAVKIRRNLDIWFHDFRGPTPRRDVGILTPTMTQPLLERVTRQIVLERGNVTLRRGAGCTIRIENGDATGVMFEGPDGGFLEGDLIIDASGRNSRLAKHLADAGFGEVESQDLRILMTYTSGLFRPPAK